jgi:hypothetical protein
VSVSVSVSVSVYVPVVYVSVNEATNKSIVDHTVHLERRGHGVQLRGKPLDPARPASVVLKQLVCDGVPPDPPVADHVDGVVTSLRHACGDQCIGTFHQQCLVYLTVAIRYLPKRVPLHRWERRDFSRRLPRLRDLHWCGNRQRHRYRHRQTNGQFAEPTAWLGTRIHRHAAVRSRRSVAALGVRRTAVSISLWLTSTVSGTVLAGDKSVHLSLART